MPLTCVPVHYEREARPCSRDTYLAEGDSFHDFLVYACAALLLQWSDELRGLDFQEILMFLQHLPTSAWDHSELEIILSKAHMWRIMFGRAPSHFL